MEAAPQAEGLGCSLSLLFDPPMTNLSGQVMTLLGLQYNRAFYRDTVFLLLLAIGPVTWFLTAVLFRFQPLPWHSVWSSAFLSVALWQPVLEELLFRGLVQGHLMLTTWGQKTWSCLTAANIMTSLLFTLAHLTSHSLSWSFLVFAPSLCFGVVRDRFSSVYPAIVLHAFYNAGYFLLTGGVTLQGSR